MRGLYLNVMKIDFTSISINELKRKLFEFEQNYPVLHLVQKRDTKYLICKYKNWINGNWIKNKMKVSPQNNK